MANEWYVPQIDYTSRDFASIRDDLMNLRPIFAPQWTSEDPSDFGIVLLELFAYVGDSLNYYIDRAANEGFVDTATQKDTLLQLARVFNYTPKSLSFSSGTVEVINGTSNSVTIPVGTRLNAVNSTTGASLIFETTEEVIVDARANNIDGKGVVSVVQGSTINNEILGYSDGSPSQQFQLSTPGVVTDNTQFYTFSVTVNDKPYFFVENLSDYYSTNEVFTTLIDSENYTYLLFGDNTNGRIPPANAEIKASYRVCDGAFGNLGANSILSISSAPNGTYPPVTVVGSSPTVGGQDLEATDSIRESIPKSLRAMNRAVTVEDFETIALQVPGVIRAKAVASTFSAVTLYIKSSGGVGMTDALRREIASQINSKTVPGITVTILDYAPVYPKMKLVVYAQPKASGTRIKYDVQTVLGTYFGESFTDFNQRFADIDVAASLLDIPGIKYVRVVGLAKATDFADDTIPTTVSTMYGHINEIFEYDADKVSIQVLGGTV